MAADGAAGEGFTNAAEALSMSPATDAASSATSWTVNPSPFERSSNVASVMSS